MRLPPESFPVVIAAVGALALGVGAVAALDGNLWGIPLALGGAWLLWWSVRVTRRGYIPARRTRRLGSQDD